MPRRFGAETNRSSVIEKHQVNGAVAPALPQYADTILLRCGLPPFNPIRYGCILNGGAFMEMQAKAIMPTTSYKEVKIGKTIYRVTSIFSGEKDLGKTLEQLAVRRAMTEITPSSVSLAQTI